MDGGKRKSLKQHASRKIFEPFNLILEKILSHQIKFPMTSKMLNCVGCIKLIPIKIPPI